MMKCVKILTFCIVLLLPYLLVAQHVKTRMVGDSVLLMRKIQYSQAARLDKKRTKPLYFDFYEPSWDSTAYRPLVINVFGGGFVAGSRDYADMKAWCKHFAGCGYAAATIDYRLISVNQISHDNFYRAGYLASLDVMAAVEFFKNNYEQYRIDTNRIFLLGQSAGATAIIHALFMDNDERPVEIPDSDEFPQKTSTCRVAGAILLWGCIQQPEIIDKDETTPLCLIHGAKDKILSIEEGHAFSRKSFPYVYGSQCIAKRLTELGRSDFEFHKFDDEGHAFYFNTLALFNLSPKKFKTCFQIAVHFMEAQ